MVTLRPSCCSNIDDLSFLGCRKTLRRDLERSYSEGRASKCRLRPQSAKSLCCRYLVRYEGLAETPSFVYDSQPVGQRYDLRVSPFLAYRSQTAKAAENG